MSDVIRFTLNDIVSWVDAASYPAAGGCHIMCLTDRQCAIVRDMCQKADLPTRFARRLYGRTFTYGDPLIQREHLKEVNQLYEEIGEGSNVACTDLVAALGDLVEALAANQGGGGGNTVVNCGSGCGSGVAGATGGLISGLTPEELLGPAAIVEPAPAGAPPEGFESWESYRLLKCRGAHYVFDSMVRSFNMLNTLSGAVGTLAAVTPMIMYYVAATSVVAPVVDIIAIAVAVIPFLVLAIGAAYETTAAVTYLNTNREVIICALYLSGSAQEAIEVAANAIEDAAEQVEWLGALSGLGDVLAPALATAASSAITTNLVNAMFHVAEDVIYPDVTCECDGEPGALWWHFSEDAEGWLFNPSFPNGRTATGSWQNPGHNPADPIDDDTISDGCLEAHVTGPNNNFQVGWYYTFDPEFAPVAVSGWRFYVDIDGSPDATWGTVLTIIYDDDAQDTVDESGESSWGTHSIAVSSGNVGKQVKELQVSMHGGVDVSEAWMSFDNIHFIDAS